MEPFQSHLPTWCTSTEFLRNLGNSEHDNFKKRKDEEYESTIDTLKKLSRCFVEDSFVNMIRNRWRFSGNGWNGEKEEESEKKRRREMREREKERKR